MFIELNEFKELENSFLKVHNIYLYRKVLHELKTIDSCNSLKRYLNVCHSVNNKTITEACNKLLLKRYYSPKSKLKIVEILI